MKVEVQARDRVLDTLLGVGQGKRNTRWPAKRHKKKTPNIRGFGCVHQVQLSGRINRFDRVAGLVGQSGGGGRNDGVDAAAGRGQ